MKKNSISKDAAYAIVSGIGIVLLLLIIWSGAGLEMAIIDAGMFMLFGDIVVDNNYSAKNKTKESTTECTTERNVYTLKEVVPVAIVVMVIVAVLAAVLSSDSTDKTYFCYEWYCGNKVKEADTYCKEHKPYVYERTTRKKSTSTSGNSSNSSSGNKYTGKYDPYDVYDYDNGDDFADEWAEEFGDDYEDGYDDAYDYWEEMN